MDEDKTENRVRVWLQANAAGRKLLNALDRVRHFHHRHTDRYHLWNQAHYRILTWTVTTVAVLLVLATLAVTFKVGRRHYRRYEEKRWQQEAQTFLARDDYRNAALCAKKVLAVNPNSLPACRVIATIADSANSPLTLDWLRRIVQNEPTVENKLVLASAGLKYQPPPFPLTVQILEGLAPATTNSDTPS